MREQGTRFVIDITCPFFPIVDRYLRLVTTEYAGPKDISIPILIGIKNIKDNSIVNAFT